MNRFAILLTILFFVLIIISGCGQKKIDTSKMAAKEVFEMKCSHCHDLPATTTYKGDNWIPLVDRMQTKNPAWIDDDEAKKIKEYLTQVSSQK